MCEVKPLVPANPADFVPGILGLPYEQVKRVALLVNAIVVWQAAVDRESVRDNANYDLIKGHMIRHDQAAHELNTLLGCYLALYRPTRNAYAMD
jgi:hypothetical protein